MQDNKRTLILPLVSDITNILFPNSTYSASYSLMLVYLNKIVISLVCVEDLYNDKMFVYFT